MRQLPMTMKTKLLLILFTLIGIISFSLLYSQYYFSKKTAISSTHKTFKIISKNISEHLKQESEETRQILEIKGKVKTLGVPITFDPLHPVLFNLVQVLEFKKSLHAIYFTQANNRYFEVVNMQNRPAIFRAFDAPPETCWTVVVIIDNVQKSSFLDKNFSLLGEKRKSVQYNPHQRPWYMKALQSKEVVSTPPYLFSFIKKMGITYAVELEKKGTVLAVDYTMEQLNIILELQKYDAYSEIFIVGKQGNKLASSTHDIHTPFENIDFIRNAIDQQLDKVLNYEEEGKDYFLILHALPKHKAYVCIKVDADHLLQLYKENIQYSFLMALFLLFVAGVVIFWSANSLVKPVNELIEENRKIKERRFSEVKRLNTNIIEFQAFSDSLLSMSKAIENHDRAQDALLDSLIKLIAEAIDNKSPYTGTHCERVPELAQMLLAEVNVSEEEAFKDFSFTSTDDQRAFEIGAWLHDCGKVTTPEYVVDKSVKLETIYNRIHEIRMRFEVLWRDASIDFLEKKIDKKVLQERQKELLEDFAFIASVNLGTEPFDEAKRMRIEKIAKQTWQRQFDNRLGLGKSECERYTEEAQNLPVTETLLADKAEHIVPREHFDHEAYAAEGFEMQVPEALYNYGELYNLCIEKGTLTEEERYKINEHVIMTIKMLEKIPFPSHLQRIPEYAGTHHERLDGKGYPRKLDASELSIPSRIMAIADIFEALTSSDRPYKKANTLSEALSIMAKMAQEKHIDKALFALFLKTGVYKRYATVYLNPEQRDEVNIVQYL